MKELFINNGNAYVVLRKIPHYNVMNKQGSIISDEFNGWKEYLGADHVLKTSTHFLYCETIQDAEWEDIIEDTQELENNNE